MDLSSDYQAMVPLIPHSTMAVCVRDQARILVLSSNPTWIAE
jgi:hypothetical protein